MTLQARPTPAQSPFSILNAAYPFIMCQAHNAYRGLVLVTQPGDELLAPQILQVKRARFKLPDTKRLQRNSNVYPGVPLPFTKTSTARQ